MYNKKLPRSFGIFEIKRLKTLAFLGIFLIGFIFYSILKPCIDHFPLLNLQLSAGIDLKMLTMVNTGKGEPQTARQIGEVSEPRKVLEPLLSPMCNFGQKSDYCEINGDIRIHGNSSILFTSSTMLSENTTFGIKLYARKIDRFIMGMLKLRKMVQKSSALEMPECTVNHTIPALVFSVGGYTGNYFHDISDVIIPLYLTALEFKGEIQFLIEGRKYGWLDKYNVILKALSNYDVVDLSRDNEIRCFTDVVVGLKAHDDLGIDPEKVPYGNTLTNFTKFLRRVYSLKRESAIKLHGKQNYIRKPRLLIIARRKTRVFLNEDEIKTEAQGLGYDVKIIDARMNMSKISKIVNSFDVMIGVHGAGLTNMVFLPENAVLIQVSPIGLHPMGMTFYGKPAINMNLNYLEYKITEKESSLLEQYSSDDPVILNPESSAKIGWLKFKSIYMDNQNVRVDVSRFKTVLVEALQLLGHQKCKSCADNFISVMK